MTREKEGRRREEWPPRIPLNFISPVHGGEGQRRLDLKRDEIFLESLDRFLGQSVPIDPPFIAPFIRVHSPILASRINDIVLVEKGFWKPFMIAATTFDFHLMEADRDQPRERIAERIASNAPLTSALVSVEIVARFRRPIPSNKATRATNAVFRDVSTAYVLRDRKQSFIARFPLFRSV